MVILQVAYIVLTATLVAVYGAVFIRLVRSSGAVTPLIGWLVGLSYFILLPLLVLVLNGGYTFPSNYGWEGRWASVDLSDPVYLWPFLIIWLSLLATAITAFAECKRLRALENVSQAWRLSTRHIKRIIIVCACLMCIEWLIQIVAAGGVSAFLAGHWYTRYASTLSRLGNIFVLYQYFSLGLMVVFTAAMALLIAAILKRQSRSYLLLLCTAILQILNLVITGNRIFIALILLYIVAATFVFKRVRLMFLLVVTLPILGVVFSAWAQIRGDLSNASVAISAYRQAAAQEDHPIANTLVGVTEGADVMLLLHIIEDYGTRYQFLYGATYGKIFTFFIPRSIYSHKEQNFTVIAAKEYEPEADTSLNSTVLGEMYANFGVFVVILMPLFTLLIGRMSRWTVTRSERHRLFAAVLFFVVVWFSRSVFSASILIGCFGYLLVWLLRFEKGLYYLVENRLPIRFTAAKVGKGSLETNG